MCCSKTYEVGPIFARVIVILGVIKQSVALPSPITIAAISAYWVGSVAVFTLSKDMESHSLFPRTKSVPGCNTIVWNAPNYYLKRNSSTQSSQTFTYGFSEVFFPLMRINPAPGSKSKLSTWIVSVTRILSLEVEPVDDSLFTLLKQFIKFSSSPEMKTEMCCYELCPLSL